MRNQPTLVCRNYLFTICLSLFSISALMAQESKVFKLNNESVNTASLINNSNVDDDTPYHLLYSLKPTIYVKDNSIINVTGPNKPASLTLYDANSLSILNTKNPLFDSVQIIKIQLNDISDLNKYVDFSSLQGFNSLGYIYIICYFDCTDSQVRAFLKNIDPEITTYFEYVKPA